VLCAWARQVGLQNQEASDLIQDVFLTLVTTLPTFVYDKSQSFRGWLRSVTLNKWRDHCKRRKAERLPADADELVDPRASQELNAFWETEYRRHVVQRALQVMQADFHPTSWKACWEHVISERPAAEVAAELGLTPGAVYAAKFRILGRLRQELEGMLD
jgi:RNA polymerase sigma-70 factor (ECF subfamily)